MKKLPLYENLIKELAERLQHTQSDTIAKIEHTLGLERIGYDEQYKMPIYMANNLNFNIIKIKDGIRTRKLIEEDKIFFSKYTNSYDKVPFAIYMNLLPVVKDGRIITASKFLNKECLKELVLTKVYSQPDILTFEYYLDDNYTIKKCSPLMVKYYSIKKALLNNNSIAEFTNNTKNNITITSTKINPETMEKTEYMEIINPGDTFYKTISKSVPNMTDVIAWCHQEKYVISEGTPYIANNGFISNRTKPEHDFYFGNDLLSQGYDIKDIPLDILWNKIGILIPDDTFTLLSFNIDNEGNTISCNIFDNRNMKIITLSKEEMIKKKTEMKYTNIKIDDNIEMIDGSKIMDIPHLII